MYVVISKIRYFGWVAIFYFAAVLINLRSFDRIGAYLAANRMPVDIDLWAVAISGIYIFIMGIRVKMKSKFHLFIKLWSMTAGIVFLLGPALSFYIMYYAGTSALNAVLSALLLAVIVFLTV